MNLLAELTLSASGRTEGRPQINTDQNGSGRPQINTEEHRFRTGEPEIRVQARRSGRAYQRFTRCRGRPRINTDEY